MNDAQNIYVGSITYKGHRKALGDLISWAVNGPEHGVITHDQWRAKCKELKKLCDNLNIPVHGQWTIV